MLYEVSTWILLFLFVVLISEFLKKNKIDYYNQFLLTSLYYLAFAWLALRIYSTHVTPFLQQVNMYYIALLFGLILITLLIAPIIVNSFKIPKKLAKHYDKAYLLRFDFRFVISKASDILFQQTMVLALVAVLLNTNLDLKNIIILFVIIFASIHSLLIVTLKKFSMFYIFGAIFGAVLFPVLITTFQNGIIFSAMAHWLYYFLGRVVFGIYFKNH